MTVCSSNYAEYALRKNTAYTADFMLVKEMHAFEKNIIIGVRGKECAFENEHMHLDKKHVPQKKHALMESICSSVEAYAF